MRADTLLLGSDHASQSALDAIVAGRAIVGCEAQSTRSTIDPALLFDGGITLEIFSVTYLEPWIVVTAGRGHFVASPSD
ncbi:hypothetical protein LF41_2465 [Lysobacter dokdonensis DS-58]|uniref:Uncharacterized protein n=1 Tax=Lysobacter dokdonensis DS-58 TaxID=1300345 RepID=A0A0A2WJG6_9GAMM|nr:hypothetical protein LF41_2465 [Lysobacter dokdonensis DS-58]